MNILFIIGNGFDLNLGMKTRYVDFYDFYTNKNPRDGNIGKLKKKIRRDIENWSDMELKLGEYVKHMESETEFEEVFENLSENLSNYLKEEEGRYGFDLSTKETLLKHLAAPESFLLASDRVAIGEYITKKSHEHDSINIITFNYTRSIEKIINWNQAISFPSKANGRNRTLMTIEHVHGFTNDRMVLGVNDLLQLHNEKFKINKNILDAIVKYNCNTACKTMHDARCEKLINEADLIYIFGSSIGATDDLWWDIVGKRLKTSDCKLVIFKKEKAMNPIHGYKNGKFDRACKEHFCERAKLSKEDSDKISKKIYVRINGGLFGSIRATSGSKNPNDNTPHKT